MESGKKSIAQGILYDALAMIEEKANKPAMEVFQKAIDNVKPELEVKSRRVGGATYQVPVEVRTDRRLALAMRWIIGYSRGRQREDDEREARGRAYGRFQQYGGIDQEDGGHEEDGGGEQGLRSLQVVNEWLDNILLKRHAT